MITPTIATFTIYIAIILVISFFAWKRTSNLNDYILGGRNLNPVTAALSAGASGMSGWLFLGLPGALFLSGFSQVWIGLGLAIGAWLNWRFVASRLRVDTATHNALTLPSWFGKRFTVHSGLIKVTSTFIIIMFFTFYAASGLVASAELFTNILDISYHKALITGAIIIAIYTSIGGFFAVSWTDVLQGLMMLMALLIVTILLFTDLPTISTVDLYTTDFLSPWGGDLGLLGLLSLVAWGLGYFGQPHILARFMAIRSSNDAVSARRIGISWMVLSLTGAILIGVFGRIWLEAQPGGVATDFNPEHIFIILTQHLLTPWLGGLILAAILAAVMSTIDSQLLVASSSLIADIIHPIFGKISERQAVITSRITVLGIALIALIIAWDANQPILALVSYAWAGLGASFGPIVLLTLYWPRYNDYGVMASMLTGATIVTVWPLLETEVYELLIAFPLAVLAGIAMSILIGKKT